MAEEIKPNPKAEALAKAKAEQEARTAALNELKQLVGKTFTDGTRTAAVIGFEPQKGLGSAWKPAYLVNFGNPNAHHYIHCDEFAQTFTTEVKG
jgi:Mn-containing catalase